jgi:hypothetical protein
VGAGPRENCGDYLSKFLVEAISGKRVKWKDPKQIKWYKPPNKVYFAIGSILELATSRCVIWGSGMIKKDSAIAPANFRAVRGPWTRKLLKDKGYKVPPIYGDPSLLSPQYISADSTKKHLLGIIPHYVEYEAFTSRFRSYSDEVDIINMLDEPREVIGKIAACEYVLSSSLHGLILSHAYSVPALRMTLSDKIFGDGIKYLDYFASVGIPDYEPLKVDAAQADISLITKTIKDNPRLSTMQMDRADIAAQLLANCPFL